MFIRKLRLQVTCIVTLFLAWMLWMVNYLKIIQQSVFSRNHSNYAFIIKLVNNSVSSFVSFGIAWVSKTYLAHQHSFVTVYWWLCFKPSIKFTVYKIQKFYYFILYVEDFFLMLNNKCLSKNYYFRSRWVKQWEENNLKM